jgi:hypothetical protein
MQRIAVAIVHGVEIADPDFAATPTRLLKSAFAKAVGNDGPDPDDALAIEPVFWAPQLEDRQRELFARMFPENSDQAFDEELSRIVRRLGSGSVLALLPFMASLLAPTLPGLSSLHYPTARWVTVHFIGDVLAYDRSTNPGNYASAQLTLAHALTALAERTDPHTPLCILAHSFGSVLVSDYIYDQQETVRSGRNLIPPQVRRVVGTSPLAQGTTLAWLYTMGNPMALWSLRCPDIHLTRPITVPGRDLARRHPALRTEWVNLYSKADLFAYPLRPLGPAYEQAVTEDRAVSLTPFPISLTPLVHPFYWADQAVMDGIGRTLAESWLHLNS